MTGRQLRSASNKASAVASTSQTLTPERIPSVKFVPSTAVHATCQILRPGTPLSDLSTTEAKLLRRKQRKLHSCAASTQAIVSSLPSHFLQSLCSTLIFAQATAGTAICISPTGLVLTCAHCIAETQDEYVTFESAWLLFYTGAAVKVRCLAWDPIRDLALLQIVTLEAEIPTSQNAERLFPSFSSIPISHSSSVRTDTPIYCIGQPGADDLESSVARKTKYDLFEISHGRFRGLVTGADPQNNSEIGALKHDAWTYWGHSGAPLLGAAKGELVGLHSSWNDKTAMRHGVHVVAIMEFLRRFVDGREDEVATAVERLLSDGTDLG